MKFVALAAFMVLGRLVAATTVVAVLAFVILVSPAMAQVNAPSIVSAWHPYVVEILAALIAAGLGWVLNKIRERTGLEINAQHRATLQATLTNVVGLLIAKGEIAASNVKINVGSPAINEAVTYVLKSAPDALKYFGIDASTPEGAASLREKIVAKIGVVTAAPAANPTTAG